ncbi:MAG: cytochrome c biogenesis protein CcsA [Planctomycetota bacterium]
MATIAKPSSRTDVAYSDDTLASYAYRVLQMAGSLKLTVSLFAISLVTVLVGTLAQDEMNMFEVKQRYFVCWIAQLHIDDFFPQAFFPHDEAIKGWIPFPGGALIGVMLMINLLAAKTTRFRVHSRGGKLVAGIGLLVLGTIITCLVAVAGHSSDGLQGRPPIEYQTLWALVLAATTVLGIGFFTAGSRVQHPTIKTISYAFGVCVAAFVLYALITGFRIGDPGLRIVWQLTKGLGAGIILLFGCLLVFDKQGGNVLLHLGVGLLMVGQFAFGDRQLEQRLNLIEGESSNTLINLDQIEMVFVERKENEDLVIPIPGSRLRQAFESDEIIDDPALPARVRVLEFFDNSEIVDPLEDNLATNGFGLTVGAVRVSKSGGTESETNFASAYVELLDSDTGESMGSYLISQWASDREFLMAENMFDTVPINGTEYDIGLKYHREVKPYWVQLEDVRRINYSGTDTPRDYSSFIRIVDPETGEDRKERVWMNNPLRYRGETFYQSQYTPLPNGKEMTGIQVVRNSGWLIPYIACSITALGMLAHFMGTLTRFLRRRERETRSEADPFETAKLKKKSTRMPAIVMVGSCALLAVYMLIPWKAVKYSMKPSSRLEQFDFYAAGKIPTQYVGRVMPLDAYARQTLKAISNKESLPLETAPSAIQHRILGEGEEASSRDKMTAMQWLMEVAIDSRELNFLPMFRIDAEEVRSELGLARRKSKLYSLDEIRRKWDRVNKIVTEVRDSRKPVREQTFKERKLMEFDRRTRQFMLATTSFRLPEPEEIPKEDFERMFPGATDAMRREFAFQSLARQMTGLKEMTAPRIVPPSEDIAKSSTDDPDWSAFAPAFFDYVIELRNDPTAKAPVGVDEFADMIRSYNEGDTAAFNKAVDEQLAGVQDYPIAGYSSGLVSLERWMQSNWPTGVAMILYLVTLVLGLVCFAANLPRLRVAVWSTIAFTLLVHTLAIACRVTITGRAPVINLYSSAVFIGWAAVLFALVCERIFRYGIGNVIASSSGVLTLLVAYGLNKDDTMPVLQAVLDTQFWLATHVISVTLGYVATLVAGTIGIAYLVVGWKGGGKGLLRDLYRCCYGAACFGILFSFVGTVLGGLWADDSWGRFWGWDPKENGALLIVIWNALMLHARWDGMVGARGFACLAIGGNVVTAWSWFGTNELGIGLHSYGFTSGVLMWLTLFMGSQLLILMIDGCLRFLRVGFDSSRPA